MLSRPTPPDRCRHMSTEEAQKQGDFEEALEHFLIVQRIDVNNPTVSSAIAALYSRMGMWNEAIVEYKNLLRIDAKYRDAK